ncbi:MAG: matrixin family metalloprotease [Bacteriovoracaceae bacterium]|nr:matrixin family metalloprotease [Bacteriovoracaceae bacterium]
MNTKTKTTFLFFLFLSLLLQSCEQKIVQKLIPGGKGAGELFSGDQVKNLSNTDTNNNGSTCRQQNRSLASASTSSATNKTNKTNNLLELEGTYQQIYVDDFIHQHTKNEHDKKEHELDYLKLESGELVRIQNSEILSHVEIGQRLKLSGNFTNETNRFSANGNAVTNVFGKSMGPNERTITANSVQVISTLTNSQTNSKYTTTTAYASLSSLVIVMNFTNRKTTDIYPFEKAKNDMKAIGDFYREVSGNNINFNTDLNQNGVVDAEVVNIDSPFTPSLCTNFSALKTLAASKLQEHNINSYTTLIFIAGSTLTGNDPTCKYGGVATVGQLGSGNNGFTHIGVPLLSVIFHELGHNLGLGHSNTPKAEYGDKVDVMGNYFGNLFQYFNGPKIKQLNLFRDSPDLEVQVTKSGVYRLTAVGHGVDASQTGTRLLTVKAGGSSHYLTYRFPAGIDTQRLNGAESLRGLYVHEGSLARAGASNVLSQLKTMNQSYKNTSSGVTVKLLSSITEEEVDVEITLPGQPAGPVCDGQLVSVELQSIELVAGSSDEYNVSYKVINNNTAACGQLVYNLSLNSQYFNLSNTSSFSVNAGQTLSVITKIKIKPGVDLTKEIQATGTLIGQETTAKVPSFSLPFTKAIGANSNGSGTGEGC